MTNRNVNILQNPPEHDFSTGGVDSHSSHASFTELVSELDENTNKVERGLSMMGLTNNEAKVYLLLAKKGASKASQVARYLNFPRTETYNLLNLLQKKGLVRCTMHYPLRFVAVSFDEAVSVLLGIEKQRLVTFETQGKALLQVWSSIVNQEVIEEETSDEKFQILEGHNAIYRRIKEMVESAEKEVMIISDQKGLAKLYHNQVTDNINSLTEKGVKVKVLTSIQPAPEITKELTATSIQVLAQPLANMHYVIIDEREMLFFIKNVSGSESVAAMWTDCESLVRCMCYLFRELWSHSDR